MLRKIRRTGEGKLGCALWLLLLAALVTAGFRMIPVKIAGAELYDFMDEQARYGARTPPEEIKKRILKRAEDLRIVLNPDDVVVSKPSGRIRMTAKYTVSVDLIVFTYDWEFEHIIDKPVFIV